VLNNASATQAEVDAAEANLKSLQSKLTNKPANTNVFDDMAKNPNNTKNGYWIITRLLKNKKFVAAFEAAIKGSENKIVKIEVKNADGKTAPFTLEFDGAISDGKIKKIKWAWGKLGLTEIYATDDKGNTSKLQLYVQWGWWEWILVIFLFGWIYL